MSETIASVSPTLPQGYEKLSGLEMVKQKDDTIRWNGILELGENGNSFVRKVQIPDPLEMWGYDSPELQAEWEARKANPEFWEMKERIEKLERQVADQVEQIGQLETKNSELQTQIATLKENKIPQTDSPPAPVIENDSIIRKQNGEPEVVHIEPESHVRVLTPEPDRESSVRNEKPETQGLPVHDLGPMDLVKGQRVAIRRPGQENEFIYKTEAFPIENGQPRVIIRNIATGEKFSVSPGAILTESEASRESDWSYPPMARESSSTFRRGWNRTTGRIGNLVLRAQLPLYKGEYTYVDSTGEIVPVERVDGYTESEIVTGERTLGVAAVAALVGGLVAYLIWGRHGASPPEVINHVHEHKVYVPTGGNHIDYLKPNGVSAVGLPMKLQVAKDTFGHDVIKNSLGQTIVRHSEVPKGFQDEQGNMSQAARAILRAKGFILTQTHVPKSGRYMTAVWNR